MPDLPRLRENEEALADALLPEDSEPTEPLEPRAQFLTHAYLVLACAVIEEYVEECFEEYTADALAQIDDSVPMCFIPLAARFADKLIGQAGMTAPAAEACRALRGLYSSKIVSPNNGIKRRNLITLAKPLGLQPALEADCESLLGPSDTLGARRGRVAHVGSIKEELRPAEARQMVLDVVDQLQLLLDLLELQ